MRHTLIITILALFAVQYAKADDGVVVQSAQVYRNGDDVVVDMVLDVSDVRLSPNKTLVLTPGLVSDETSVELPPVEVMGRRQYIYHQRNGGKGNNVYLRTPRTRQTLVYSATTPYQDWMDGSLLVLSDSERKCCRKLITTYEDIVGSVDLRPAFTPLYAYIRETSGQTVKEAVKSISGSAYINFIVGKWDIRENYLDNAAELRRIRATIDSVMANPDVEITRIHLKGYASPEGSVSTNTTLADNRTRALRDYLLNAYNIPGRFITTESGGEDWDGLRRYVESSSLMHRNAILNAIDSGRSPDNKEYYIRSTWPDDYKILKNDCYPSLRHTDYTIEYQTIHRTTETTLPPDEVINLNAANDALASGDIESAAAYLDKAGDSPEASNARAILAWLKGDAAEARAQFSAAAEAGLPQARTNLENLEKVL
ncbi:MAG: DUF3868 domain-containing protein [Bacteroidales bacterium]|nr:DUF3868 domain-containing protein [Bacteroidales bacterium]